MRTTYIRAVSYLIPLKVDLWEAIDLIAARAYDLVARSGGSMYESPPVFRSVSTTGDHIDRSSTEELREIYEARGLALGLVSVDVYASSGAPTRWSIVMWGWPLMEWDAQNFHIETKSHDAGAADELRTALRAYVASLSRKRRFRGIEEGELASRARAEDGLEGRHPRGTYNSLYEGRRERRELWTYGLAEAASSVAATDDDDSPLPRKKPNWALRWTVIGVVIAAVAVPVAIFGQDIREFFVGDPAPSVTSEP